MKIFLLMGGTGGERDVSLRSGERVRTALAEAGHTVSVWDWRGEPLSAATAAAAREADAVFLALHGGAGEDGTLQVMLERAGIYHYTGTGPGASALAMNKALAKDAVQAAGVPATHGVIWQPHQPSPPLTYPAVIKPLCGGSSVGLMIAENAHRLTGFCPIEPVLCEEHLPGAEYTVGILAGEVLPVVEIRPRSGTYDYASKYTAGAAEELCPAPISAELSETLQRLALDAFRALGLRDYGRIDFKSDAAGRPRFLEANTLPGMTATSLLPLAAAAAGISFPALCERIAAMAAERHSQKKGVIG
jgi:D-alanine-D-alanine ligase